MGIDPGFQGVQLLLQVLPFEFFGFVVCVFVLFEKVNSFVNRTQQDDKEQADGKIDEKRLEKRQVAEGRRFQTELIQQRFDEYNGQTGNHTGK